MKRLLGALFMAGLLLLVTVAAQGRLSKLANGSDGYHHLLMLDQREALEHLKALHYYVQNQDGALDAAILGAHIDEIGRNLNGMKAELAKVEEATHSVPLADVRRSQERAEVLYGNLKELALQPSPKPEQLRAVSFETYQYVRNASILHGHVMSKLGVQEPYPPSR